LSKLLYSRVFELHVETKSAVLESPCCILWRIYCTSAPSEHHTILSVSIHAPNSKRCILGQNTKGEPYWKSNPLANVAVLPQEVSETAGRHIVSPPPSLLCCYEVEKRVVAIGWCSGTSQSAAGDRQESDHYDVVVVVQLQGGSGAASSTSVQRGLWQHIARRAVLLASSSYRTYQHSLPYRLSTLKCRMSGVCLTDCVSGSQTGSVQLAAQRLVQPV